MEQEGMGRGMRGQKRERGEKESERGKRREESNK